MLKRGGGAAASVRTPAWSGTSRLTIDTCAAWAAGTTASATSVAMRSFMTDRLAQRGKGPVRGQGCEALPRYNLYDCGKTRLAGTSARRSVPPAGSTFGGGAGHSG